MNVSAKKIGLLEIHRDKSWFDQKSSELANKRKQAKFLWPQNPNDQIAEDFSNVKPVERSNKGSVNT